MRGSLDDGEYKPRRDLIRAELPAEDEPAENIEQKEKIRMINGKQRRYLKQIAQETPATVYIGVNGLTENIKKEIENGFEAREIVKVKLQNGAALDPKEVANELAEEMGAEFVQAIGKVFVLYRESKDNKTIVLPR